MDINEFQYLLQKKLTGELTAAEEKLLEEQYGQLLEQEVASGDDIADATAKERMRQAIHARILPGRKQARIYNMREWVAAAAVLLLLTASAYVWLIKGNSAVETVTIVAGDTVRHVTLPDGSVVVLNKGSRLHYPVSFTKKERMIRLEGEAFCEVVHNEQQPFVVASGNLRVQDVGTSFVVTAFSEKSPSLVTVLTGEVMVQQAGMAMGNLHPNEQLSIDHVTGNKHIQRVDAMAYTVWTHPSLQFNSTVLEQVFTRLEKEYHVHLTGSTASLLQQPFSGNFQAGTRIEDIMSTLAGIYNFRYTYNHENLTIQLLP